jgi:hypothetical protein
MRIISIPPVFELSTLYTHKKKKKNKTKLLAVEESRAGAALQRAYSPPRNHLRLPTLVAESIQPQSNCERMYFDTESINTINDGPRPVSIPDTCDFWLYKDGSIDFLYQGTDLRYHSAYQHHDHFSDALIGLTICFCYRTYDLQPYGPPSELVLQRATFRMVPSSIRFRQIGRPGL